MIANSLKAIVAFGGTFIAVLTGMLQDKTSVDSMTLTEWLVTLGAALGVALVTWLVPNYAYTPKQP